MKAKLKHIAVRTSLMYGAFAVLWILVSDRLLFSLVSEPEILSTLSIYKGWFFVISTAILLYVLINRDVQLLHAEIQERKETERALQLSEEQFQHLFENAPVGIGLADMQGNLIEFNNAMLQPGGYTREDILHIGNVAQLYYDISDREKALTLFRQHSELKNFPVQFKRKDGTPYDTLLSLSLIQFKGQGCILATVQDITERKRAEDALRKTELRFRSLIEHNIDAIALLKSDGTILYESPAVQRILGYAPEELVGRNAFEFLHPDDVETGKKLFAQLLQQPKTPFTHQVRYAHKNGTWVWLEAVGANFLNDPNVESIVVNFRDITERQQAEEALRESEERFRILVDEASDAFYVHDLEGNIFDVNEQACKSLGYTRNELLSMSLREIIVDFDIDKARMQWERIDINKPATITGYLRAKSGKIFPVEVRLSCCIIRQKKLILALARDISDRKKTEEELLIKDFAIESSISAIALADLNGNITYVNKAFTSLWKYSDHTEVLGKHISEFALSAEILQQIINGAEKGETYIGETVAYTKSRQPFNVQLSVNIVKNADGKPISIMMSGVDITDRKKKEEERLELERKLLHSQKMESIGTLAAGIAHDFNNILGILLGYTTLLSNFQNDRERFRHYVDIMIKTGERGASLVRQLLTFARKAAITNESINVNNLIHELTKLFRETFPKTITVQLSLQEQLPSIHADSSQINQVLLNLCVNARDAMPNGGILFLSTSVVHYSDISSRFPKASHKQYVQLTVTDTGVGMDDKTRERIFEPFFTTKEIGKGTGLGLSVVFGIVENHGGFTAVESELGKGTTFYVYLPIPEKESVANEAALIANGEPPSGNEVILLVEDEHSLQDLVKTVLEAKGYTVLTADDGFKGMKLFQQHHNTIAVIISDIGLPGISGKEMARKILTEHPKTKIIMASGYFDPEIKKELDNAGLKYFIHKPYNPTELLYIVRSVIDEAPHPL